LQYTTPLVDEQGQIVNRLACRVQQFTEDLSSGTLLELVELLAGAFLMGSPLGTGYEDERPQHRVAVAPFWMSRYLITQAQWQSVMGRHAGRFSGLQRPVENVSWHEANRFCERLSRRTGRHYRLPSEAQWEYACRAGTNTPFAFGSTLTTDLANYNGEFTFRAEPKGVYRHVTTDVDSFPPNAFGLCDMHGNLWEWCADPWHDSYQGAPTGDAAWQSGGDPAYRVVRGGSWHDTPDVCRSAVRLKLNAAEGDEMTGFRVVLPAS
jgi:formylglycine-generating enzyme required for sulfatase activity